VIQYTDLTEDQKRKFRLLDNRLGDLAEYDIEALKEELKAIDDKWLTDMFKDFDLGLDQEEEWNEETEDDAPEIDEEEEPIVKEGDIFELEGKA
jgi:site-specific DNA-methyltransferase (adenine-specific)